MSRSPSGLHITGTTHLSFVLTTFAVAAILMPLLLLLLRRRKALDSALRPATGGGGGGGGTACEGRFETAPAVWGLQMDRHGARARKILRREGPVIAAPEVRHPFFRALLSPLAPFQRPPLDSFIYLSHTRGSHPFLHQTAHSGAVAPTAQEINKANAGGEPSSVKPAAHATERPGARSAMDAQRNVPTSRLLDTLSDEHFGHLLPNEWVRTLCRYASSTADSCAY